MMSATCGSTFQLGFVGPRSITIASRLSRTRRVEEVIKLVDLARVQSAALNDQLAIKYRIGSEDLPISGLNMANTNCVLALEALVNYNRLWNAPRAHSPSQDFEQLRKENGERVMRVNKASFILTLS